MTTSVRITTRASVPRGGGYGNILDGAFGGSLEDHIRDVYLWLAERYEAKGEIYLLGFSRGAFTVRCVAGMLKRPGLVVLRQRHGFAEETEGGGAGLSAHGVRSHNAHVKVRPQ